MPLPNDEDGLSYDDPTAEELEWQIIEARLEEYHAECWESVFGDVIDEMLEGARNDAG